MLGAFSTSAASAAGFLPSAPHSTSGGRHVSMSAILSARTLLEHDAR